MATLHKLQKSDTLPSFPKIGTMKTTSGNKLTSKPLLKRAKDRRTRNGRCFMRGRRGCHEETKRMKGEDNETEEDEECVVTLTCKSVKG